MSCKNQFDKPSKHLKNLLRAFSEKAKNKLKIVIFLIDADTRRRRIQAFMSSDARRHFGSPNGPIRSMNGFRLKCAPKVPKVVRNIPEHPQRIPEHHRATCPNRSLSRHHSWCPSCIFMTNIASIRSMLGMGAMPKWQRPLRRPLTEQTDRAISRLRSRSARSRRPHRAVRPVRHDRWL